MMPCNHCGHPRCQLCWWVAQPGPDGDFYRAYWGEGVAAPEPGSVAMVECGTCAGRVRIKLHPGILEESAARLLDHPKDGWPAGWESWPGFVAARAARAGGNP